MITDKQYTAIKDLAERFGWTADEIDATITTLEKANHRDLVEKAITTNARAFDWSPVEEAALRKELLGKDANIPSPHNLTDIERTRRLSTLGPNGLNKV